MTLRSLFDMGCTLSLRPDVQVSGGGLDMGNSPGAEVLVRKMGLNELRGSWLKPETLTEKNETLRFASYEQLVSSCVQRRCMSALYKKLLSRNTMIISVTSFDSRGMPALLIQ